MKHSLLLVALVATFGLAACSKPTAPAAYTGPNKAAYDAAVESCKTASFDSRETCVKKAMAEAAPAADATKPVAAAAAPAPAKK